MGVAVEGPTEETQMEEGGEGLKAVGRAGFKLEGPGMPDLISSE